MVLNDCIVVVPCCACCTHGVMYCWLYYIVIQVWHFSVNLFFCIHGAMSLQFYCIVVLYWSDTVLCLLYSWCHALLIEQFCCSVHSTLLVDCAPFVVIAPSTLFTVSEVYCLPFVLYPWCICCTKLLVEKNYKGLIRKFIYVRKTTLKV